MNDPTRETIDENVSYLRSLACTVGGPERVRRLNQIADDYARLAKERAVLVTCARGTTRLLRDMGIANQTRTLVEAVLQGMGEKP